MGHLRICLGATLPMTDRSDTSNDTCTVSSSEDAAYGEVGTLQAGPEPLYANAPIAAP
jgi:hypothetical protein